MVGQNNIRIPTYVINLKERCDRLFHTKHQFSGKPEFEVTVVEAVKNDVGTIGLWQTIIRIVRSAAELKMDYILICEDDHQFTKFYQKEHLIKCIMEANAHSADVLLGGVSSLRSIIPVTQHLFWTERFTGLQFTVIFERFYGKLLSDDRLSDQPADHRISSLTTNKFFIYPFISVQKEFGYSDVTLTNNESGRVTELFDKASETVRYLQSAKDLVTGRSVDISQFDWSVFKNITIPTYIVNLRSRIDRLKHIQGQFHGRNEFDVTIVEAERHRVGAVGLWITIRKIVQMAIDKEDDLILICEDDHEFTKAYSWDFLLRNIIEAHQQGVDVLSGGIGDGFSYSFPVSKNRFWINHFFCTQFIVIYRKFFDKILTEPFDERVTADDLISELTSNKMVLYPFISVQKDFGYSDVTNSNNDNRGMITALFKEGESRLALLQNAHRKYAR
jgi:hypothetical protein